MQSGIPCNFRKVDEPHPLDAQRISLSYWIIGPNCSGMFAPTTIDGCSGATVSNSSSVITSKSTRFAFQQLPSC